MLIYFIKQHQDHIHQSQPMSSEISLSVENMSSLRWQMQVFQNANLYLKVHMLLLATNLSFSFKWQAHFIHFENSYQILWIIIVSYSFKNTFPWCNYCTFVGSRSVSCVFLISSHEILKHWLKKINIYCFIKDICYWNWLFNFLFSCI